MNTPHTMTLPVAVRSLLADMRGDVDQGRLPALFALNLTYALMQLNRESVIALNRDVAAAGWDHFMRNDMAMANKWSSAHHYCDTALQILASHGV